MPLWKAIASSIALLSTGAVSCDKVGHWSGANCYYGCDIDNCNKGPNGRCDCDDGYEWKEGGSIYGWSCHRCAEEVASQGGGGGGGSNGGGGLCDPIGVWSGSSCAVRCDVANCHSGPAGRCDCDDGYGWIAGGSVYGWTCKSCDEFETECPTPEEASSPKLWIKGEMKQAAKDALNEMGLKEELAENMFDECTAEGWDTCASGNPVQFGTTRGSQCMCCDGFGWFWSENNPGADGSSWANGGMKDGCWYGWCCAKCDSKSSFAFALSPLGSAFLLMILAWISACDQ